VLECGPGMGSAFAGAQSGYLAAGAAGRYQNFVAAYRNEVENSPAKARAIRGCRLSFGG
jgi:hypothetical protein